VRSRGKIIHVVIDDKFIESAIRLFEAAEPDEHLYLMVDVQQPYVYVKDERVRGVTRKEFEDEINSASTKVVIFHSLPPRHYQLIRLIPDSKKVIWIGWGYDYVDLYQQGYPGGYVLRESAKISRARLVDRVRQSLSTYANGGLDVILGRSRAETLARVDYFSPVLEAEYVLMRRHNPWFKAEYISWNYCTVEDDLSIQSGQPEYVGNNLLVGNSATSTNNHVELFRLIRERLDLQSRKVIVPLSYGESGYREQVLHYGREILGNSFTPLIEFMPAAAYIETLHSCGFVYMNHIRQQALGNILISSLLGAKPYINPISPVYGWLKQLGMHIGNVLELDDVPLSENERVQNAQAVRAHWNRATQIERTRKLIGVVS
jgi:dTDP-N-acetylfucosamine:lipid II N-acetylfucosaminyltransferase